MKGILLHSAPQPAASSHSSKEPAKLPNIRWKPFSNSLSLTPLATVAIWRVRSAPLRNEIRLPLSILNNEADYVGVCVVLCAFEMCLCWKSVAKFLIQVERKGVPPLELNPLTVFRPYLTWFIPWWLQTSYVVALPKRCACVCSRFGKLRGSRSSEKQLRRDHWRCHVAAFDTGRSPDTPESSVNKRENCVEKVNQSGLHRSWFTGTEEYTGVWLGVCSWAQS